MGIHFFLILLSFALSTACAKSPSTKKYTLSVACIFKNDAEYLKEWIEYHRIVGVEHFYLLNNESNDSSKTVLQPYIEQGIVTLTDWKDNETAAKSNEAYAWVFSTQVPALEHGGMLAKRESKWVAFIDTDEFLVPIQENSVVDVLNKHDSEVGVAIHWRVFGTSNVRKIKEDQLLIEMLTRCTTPDDGLCNPVKTIAKTEEFVKFAPSAPHYCDYVDNKHPLHLSPDEIVINHYMNRDQNHFCTVKIRSREKMTNCKLSPIELIKAASAGNAMEDDKKHIFRFIPELRKRMNYAITN